MSRKTLRWIAWLLLVLVPVLAASLVAQSPEAWRLELGTRVTCGIAVASDGLLYAGCADGVLYTVGPEGALGWSFATGGAIGGVAVTSGQKLILVGSTDHSLYALDPTGGLQWSFEASDEIRSAPSLATDGTIVLGCDGGYLYALHPDGSLNWTFDAAEEICSAPTVLDDGTILFGTEQGGLWAVDPAGSLLWRLEIGYELSAELAESGGILYVTGEDVSLQAITTAGDLLWSFEAPHMIGGAPAAGLDGSVYFGCWDHHLYAIGPSGDLVWTFPTDGRVRSTPVVDGEGRIYFGSDDGYVYVLDPGGVLMGRYAAASPVRARTALLDGRLLVAASEDGVVHGWLLDDSAAPAAVTGDESEELASYCRDDDGDGWGDAADCRELASAGFPYTAVQIGDCDDDNPSVHPGAAESCDGVDNDCDGQIDEEDAAGCERYYRDLDGDTWGIGASKCLCSPSASYSATRRDDCDDANPLVNPGAAEVCDGVDNDCDGQIDEEDATGCTTYYYDYDGDAYGDAAVSGKCLCGPSYPTLYTATQWNDCDDANPLVNPGMSPESDCTDGKDNDCDGLTDGDDPDCGSP